MNIFWASDVLCNISLQVYVNMSRFCAVLPFTKISIILLYYYATAILSTSWNVLLKKWVNILQNKDIFKHIFFRQVFSYMVCLEFIIPIIIFDLWFLSCLDFCNWCTWVKFRNFCQMFGLLGNFLRYSLIYFAPFHTLFFSLKLQ